MSAREDLEAVLFQLGGLGHGDIADVLRSMLDKAIQEQIAAMGASAEPVESKRRFDIFVICNAYESGFGKGLVFSEDRNAYKEGSHEWHAWNIGYQEGYAKFISTDSPPNAQALIDAATERVALALQMQRSPILAENIRTEFLGKPLNDSKGG